MCFSFRQILKALQFMAQFTLSTAPISQPQSLFELVTDLGGGKLLAAQATISLKNDIDEPISGSLAVNWPPTSFLLSPTKLLENIFMLSISLKANSGKITLKNWFEDQEWGIEDGFFSQFKIPTIKMRMGDEDDGAAALVQVRDAQQWFSPGEELQCIAMPLLSISTLFQFNSTLCHLHCNTFTLLGCTNFGPSWKKYTLLLFSLNWRILRKSLVWSTTW